MRIRIIREATQLPTGLPLDALAEFLHESLRPYEDTESDIRRALSFVLEAPGDPQGFIALAMEESDMIGAAVVHFTPWSGYVPENLLLFVAVAPDRRGEGIGRRLLEKVIETCDGEIKLHVEHDNPARRLYERVGFTSKYAEMRLSP